MKNNKLILWLLIFLVSFTILQNLKGPEGGDLTQNNLGVLTQKSEYRVGKGVLLELRNNTKSTIFISQDTPDEPFNVFYYENGEWEQITASEEMIDDDAKDPLTLEPNATTKINYQNWAYRLFSQTGRYRIEIGVIIEGEPHTFTSNEFTIRQRTLLGRVWIEGVYRPIQNALVALIKLVPGQSLGWGIILLTLIIRTLLLIPSQRAMRSQRKMQDVQQEIDALKKKHKDNQERLAMETMALWKKHKVNPFGSCLMMLIQFPILIALYYVIQGGLHPDKMGLLYEPVARGFDFARINVDFLGILNLTEINFIVLPLIVGGLQFFQMQLMMARRKKKETTKPAETKKPKKKEGEAPDMQSQMQMANNMMKYVMPAMIAFFTASLPAGVGLYWGTSTLYGIGQQLVVNKTVGAGEKDKEAIVRVIEK